MLLIVNLQFSEFLQFGNLAICRMESQPELATSFSEKIEQTKIEDLATYPKFWKSQTTEVLSSKLSIAVEPTRRNCVIQKL